MKYPAYKDYKYSGVDWIGEIPFSWEMWKIKHFSHYIGSGTTPDTGIDGNYGGDTLWVTTGELRENVITDTQKKVSSLALLKYSSLRLHPAGAVAIAMYGATIGRLGILGVDATTNQACCVFPPSKIMHSKYLFYWLLGVRKEIINLASGGGQPNINQEKLSSLRVSAPKYYEQTQIATFLNRETAKIDRLIEKQKRLIELLEEKRQAVISHAVTKGLNPDVPMKDSGVEWLGEVPEHWRILKAGWLGRLFGSESISDDDISDEGHIPFIKVSSLSLKSFEIEKKNFFVSTSCKKRIRTEYNYLVFPKRGAAIFTNKVNFVDQPSVIDPNLMGWKLNELVNPIFIAHILKLRRLDDIADVSTLPQINNKHIQPLKLPIPPRQEQEAIIESLNSTIQKFDLLAQKTQEAILLLIERRSALISAAVTGKIDVRDQVPQDVEEAVAS